MLIWSIIATLPRRAYPGPAQSWQGHDTRSPPGQRSCHVVGSKLVAMVQTVALHRVILNTAIRS